jgi:hypothetical protein
MRKSVIIGGPVVAAVVLTLILWRPREIRPPDPVYSGRPLSSWLNNPILGRKEAIEAVQSAGTNAIPMLLRLLRVKDPAEVPWMARGAISTERFMPVSDVMRWHMGANLGFEVLGTNARGAVAALMGIVSNSVSTNCQSSAITALGDIGRPAAAAVPLLVKCSTNSDEVVRWVAVDSLCKIHAEPEKVVPVLIRALSERSKNMESTVLLGLEDYGRDAKAAAPAILNYLEAHQWDPEKEDFLESFAQWALKAVDPEAAFISGFTNRCYWGPGSSTGGDEGK